MNSESKKKNESPASNYEEEIPENKVPAGDKVVKKPEDEEYNRDEVDFNNPAEQREKGEQPVHPVKKAPKA